MYYHGYRIIECPFGVEIYANGLFLDFFTSRHSAETFIDCLRAL